MEDQFRTVLLTDLAGYTSLTCSSSRKQISRTREIHKQLIPPIVEQNHGEIIKCEGDAYLSVFESPTDAILAAKKIREASLKIDPEYNFPEIRFVLTAGDIIRESEDIQGEAVILAYRIEKITPKGKIWVDAAVANNAKSAEVQLVKLGAYSFKGFPGKTTIYEAFPSELTMKVLFLRRWGKLIAVLLMPLIIVCSIQKYLAMDIEGNVVSTKLPLPTEMYALTSVAGRSETSTYGSRNIIAHHPNTEDNSNTNTSKIFKVNISLTDIKVVPVAWAPSGRACKATLNIMNVGDYPITIQDIYATVSLAEDGTKSVHRALENNGERIDPFVVGGYNSHVVLAYFDVSKAIYAVPDRAEQQLTLYSDVVIEALALDGLRESLIFNDITLITTVRSVSSDETTNYIHVVDKIRSPHQTSAIMYLGDHRR